jgi:uncharacterized protein DUF4255
VATFRAIAAVSRAVLKLLEDSCPRREFPDAQFELRQALDFQKGPFGEGVSLFLYRVAVNGSRRNLPVRTDLDGIRVRPPLPLDLSYVVCAWGRSVDVQQRLLGYCARALEDTPILPAGLLNQNAPEATTFRPDETVELVAETVSWQDLHLIWELVKPNVPLGMCYIARAVPIESTIAVAEYRPVQTRVFDMAGAPE